MSESDDRFLKAFTLCPEGVVITRFSDGVIMDANDTFIRMVGVARAEALGTPWWELGEWANPEDGQLATASLNETGQILGREVVFRRRDGRLVPVLASARFIELDGVQCVLWFGRDITQRKRVEDAFRRREGMLEAVTFASECFLRSESWRSDIEEVLARLGEAADADSVYIFEQHAAPDGTTLASARYTWRLPRLRGQGVDPAELMNIPMAQSGFARWEALLQRGEAVYGPVADLPDEERSFFALERSRSLVAVPIFVGKRWWGFIGCDTWSDDLEWSHIEVEALRTAATTLGAAMYRERVESALRDSERKYRLVAENSSDAIWTIDMDSMITYSSPSVSELLGYAPEELLHKSYKFLMTEASYELVQVRHRERLAAQERHPDANILIQTEVELVRKDGSGVWMEVATNPLRDEDGNIHGVVGVARDITERRRAEKALRAASRMEATSTLAGGIAHRFNNLMAVVLGNADLARDSLPEDDAAYELLEEVRKAGEAAAALVRQLLAFARSGRYWPTVVNLNSVVEETLRLKSWPVPVGIRVEADCLPGLWLVRADRSQMAEAVTNLVLNAIESIPGEGKITVRTRNQAPEEGLDPIPGKPRGASVCIEVEDTGCGMGPEAAARVFEPFYSTKFQGRGLGLAAVYGIVKNHGGYIEVDSEEGVGSTFKIYLPADADAKAGAEDRKAKPSQGKETILVIGDQASTHDVTMQMLERLGYQVVGASSAREATEILAQGREALPLILVDTDAVDAETIDVCCLIAKTFQESRLILAGMTEGSEHVRALLDAGAKAFVQKPASGEALARQIRKVLDE